MSDHKKLSLQDLHIGLRFSSARYLFSAEDMIDFAEHYDPQPFHLDAAAAQRSPFGGLVASGWHAAAVCMRLMVESIHLDCGLIGLGGTLQWLQPVRPGMTLHVENEVISITPSRSKPNQAVVEMHCRALDEKDKTLIDMTAKLMVFARTETTA